MTGLIFLAAILVFPAAGLAVLILGVLGGAE